MYSLYVQNQFDESRQLSSETGILTFFQKISAPDTKPLQTNISSVILCKIVPTSRVDDPKTNETFRIKT